MIWTHFKIILFHFENVRQRAINGITISSQEICVTFGYKESASEKPLQFRDEFLSNFVRSLEEGEEEGDFVVAPEPRLTNHVAGTLAGLPASRQRIADEAGRARANGA